MVTDKDVQVLGDRCRAELPKSPTGVTGFDEITMGGLPSGRPTLVSRPPGSGKTLFALQFLIHGATRCAEPGVCLSFEGSRSDPRPTSAPSESTSTRWSGTHCCLVTHRP
jgi:predicted ATP-dependent serine protease